ncbi:MAG: hypothetical protein V8R10_09185 [Christensenellales bacterium]
MAVSLFFGITQGISRLRTRRGGIENRRMFAIAPSTPSGAHSMFLGFLSEVFILVALLPPNHAEALNPAINRRSFPQ